MCQLRGGTMGVGRLWAVLLVLTYSSAQDNSNNHIHPQLNLTFLQELDKGCANYCADQAQYNSICVNQGCKQWRTGLRLGCGHVCNGSESNFRELHACQQGCSKVIEDYYFHVTGVVGVPDPPTLISDSLNNTSVRLSWDGSVQPLPYLEFCIQKRFYHRNSAWETVPTEPLNQTSFLVVDLKPYTEYQFRIGWILAHDFPAFYSSESNPIGTLAKGLPNAPEITSIQPISNTSVSITWLPPSQPNGPLVAYILKLQELPAGHRIIKEIPMGHNQRGYTFSGLVPNTNYSLAITVQNREGEGLPANIQFLTPQSSMSNDISKRPEPRLLLQGVRDVYIQQIDLLLEPDVSVYISNQNVTAMSAHFKRKLVFVATAEGHVVRTSLEKNQTTVILAKEKLDMWVAFLSVDWLHDKLYLVGKKKRSATWSIKRCDLNGERLTTVLPNLNAQPIDFMADPYTGYLYWVSPQPFNPGRDALYKMDLLGEDGQMPAHLPIIPVLEGTGLGPFTIDFPNYRILIVHKARNTVLAVTLDGEATDVRQNSQSPQFGDVQSIGTYGGIFYWTTGQSVVIEEYNAAQDSFYHNSYDVPKTHLPCSRLILLHPDLQPIPTPMAPPMVPQGIFSQRRARVIWRPPPQIAGLGEGAWRDWKYQIRLSDNSSISNISDTEFVLDNLKPSTYYSIQVLAYSSNGRGPLSLPFRGRTLRETGYNMSFVWASEAGIYSSDPLGEGVSRLVFPTQWRNRDERWSVSSLAWHDASLFFSVTNGSVFHYDGGRGLNSAAPAVAGVKHLRGISFAHSVAFDYVGEKLYWSNPKKQAILRCNLRDISAGNVKGASEWLPLMSMAQEIAVDSYKALLLWTTGHTLEMSRLNGYHHSVLYSVGMFSGVRMMGITLDTDQSRVYWISRNSTGSALYRLSYNLKSTQIPSLIAAFDDVSISGPIRYYSDRLMWLQGSSEAVITDVYGQGKSSLSLSSISNLSQVLVRDPSSQRFPPGLTRGRLVVTPTPVPSWSIAVTGKWNDFTISWQPVNNTNYGRVFYEVTVNNYNAKPTPQLAVSIENSTMFAPFSEVEISVTAITYWASSKATIVKRQTPSAKPSEPLNPRIFLERLSGTYSTDPDQIRAELRWEAPLEPNGAILGYLVHCWKEGVKASDCHCQVDVKRRSCEMRTLSMNASYQFSIQAYTDAGAGKASRKIQCSTNYANPLSKLLLAAGDKLQVLDVDRNQLTPVPSPYNPITATYLASQDWIFWFDEGQYLMRSSLDGSNKTRIAWLESGEASHLVVDWIARKLYWISESTEANVAAEEKYSIVVLDLSQAQSPSPETLLTSPTPIKSIAVNPFRSSIVWTTSRRNGILTLYTSPTEGGTVTAFLSRDTTQCNCSSILSVGEAIAFDSNGFESISRGIILNDAQSIWLADENGCECRRMVNMSGSSVATSMSPHRITADRDHVYWTSIQSHGSHSLYASDKRGNGITELTNGGGPLIREVTVLGAAVQPYPGLECLVAQRLEVEEPILFNHSSHSLHLQLPLPLVGRNCSLGRVSSATPTYSVYYGPVDDNGITTCTPASLTHCKVLTSTRSLLHIEHLHPYTTYTVFVTVTNYYAQSLNLPPLVCTPIMLRTAPGAPMPPKLLRLEPLSPVSVRVVWGQPEKLNGEKVWYEVKWQTGGSLVLPQHKDRAWADTESRSTSNRSELSHNITNLQSASNYSVWVVAFSEKGDAFSESEVHQVHTFANPNNVTLINATPHLLSVSWIPPPDTSILRHQLIYSVSGSSEWNSTELVNFTVPGRAYNVTVAGLRPKTLYAFRLLTWYKGDPLQVYYWPRQGHFSMETRADKPGAPGVPIARGIGKALYEVSWERAEENGAAVEAYSLECLVKYSPDKENVTVLTLEDQQQHHRQTRATQEVQVAEKFVASEPTSAVARRKPNQNQWFVVYNGTDARWQAQDLDVRSQYVFRVRARNLYGWGAYSRESATVAISDLIVVAEPQTIGLIFGVISLGIFILATFGLLLVYVYRRKLKEKPALQSPTAAERREVELATLRELPAGSSFVHQSNVLYDADLILEFDFDGVPIPKVKKQHISLMTLLGSGAFGDVYEGFALNLPGATHEQQPGFGTRVAIKTLRKGATRKEKIGFIEEARLMAQFRHPHILQLLGLCVDRDPCLILELMSGGDLLSYLRTNRTPGLSNASSHFRLADLLGMCVDVAKGCVYLEDLHFVHRDLAARNCLVRVLEADGDGPPQRVVKIGDFGLARDIYRNDYYRKEGEGLVPVRWMAPESLVDGVFTTQSDVWAFGVLLWEIMTLGHQPYPARSNLEVLHYVRTGGRLNQPPNCPETLSELMVACWEYAPDNRPSFKDCLAQLELISQMYDVPLNHPRTPSMEQASFPQHLESQSGGTRSTLPLVDSADNDCVFAGYPESTPTAYPDSRPTMLYSADNGAVDGQRDDSSSGFPKYLEVLDDSAIIPVYSPDHAELDDGYEIPLPRKPPRNPRLPPLSRFSISSGDEPALGIPSPPPYWNTGRGRESHQSSPTPVQYFRAPPAYVASRKAAQNSESSETESHFRTLLASSTSEQSEEMADEDLSPTHGSSSSDDQELFYEGPLREEYSDYHHSPSGLLEETYNRQACLARNHSSPALFKSVAADYAAQQRQFQQPHFNSNRPCVKAANSG